MAQSKDKTNKLDKLRNKSAIRPLVRKTSYYYLTRYAMAWYYLRLSLALDPLAYGLGLSYRSPVLYQLSLFEISVGTTLLSIALVIGLGGPSELYLRLRKLQRIFSSTNNQRWIPALAIMLGLIPIAEIAIRIVNVKSAVIGLFFGAALVYSVHYIYKHSQSIKNHMISFDREPIKWIEHQNKLVFGFNFGTALVLRIVSLLTALYLGLTLEPASQSVLVIITSWLLLIALKPNSESFMTNCPRCLLLTSVVIKELGSCPACNPDKFQTQTETKSTTPKTNTAEQPKPAAIKHKIKAKR